MTELLAFADQHPVLTVILLFIVCGTIVSTAQALRGKR